MLQPDSKVLGQIIDVGRGGLAIRYIPSRECPKVGDEEYQLNILLADHSFYFDSFRCRIVSDCSVSDYEFGFSLVPMRRRSIVFLNLTENQVTQLEYFVRNHTANKKSRTHIGFTAS